MERNSCTEKTMTIANIFAVNFFSPRSPYFKFCPSNASPCCFQSAEEKMFRVFEKGLQQLLVKGYVLMLGTSLIFGSRLVELESRKRVSHVFSMIMFFSFCLQKQLLASGQMTRLNFVFIYILHCFHRIMNYFTSKFIIKSFQPSYFLPTLTRHYDNVSQVFMKCGQS